MKAGTEKLPQARQDELFIEQVGEELLVYDAQRHCAHRLNPTAAWMWLHCDGHKTIAETTQLLSDELQQPVDEELVWLSLETLEKANLLTAPLPHPTGVINESRRAMIQKLALAGGMMFLLPAITPLTKAAQAQGPGEEPAGAGESATPVIVRIVSPEGKHDSSVAIHGYSEWGGGVYGTAHHGIGIQGESTAETGVHGRCPGGNGVWGWSRRGIGVLGEAASGLGYGVKAINTSGTALYAESKGNREGVALAGFFKGDVEVTGDIRLTNADCAEDFDIVDAETVEAGTVMVLCAEGALQSSQTAYDKRVAGVISGAGDYKPGLILDKRPNNPSRKPVALMGKVFCKADASYGPIEAGDLLTTSDTPGHAMKAGDPTQAFGAVVGKALRALPKGQGLIPILVSLQ